MDASFRLNVTKAEWEPIASLGSGVVFREGVRCECRTCINGRSGHRRPPAEFVEAAAACEVCRATRWLRPPDETSGGQVCVFCLDGKRRVAVVVPCEHLTVRTVGNELECIRCLGDGFVTVGHVVVTWGPDLQDDGQYALGVEVV